MTPTAVIPQAGIVSAIVTGGTAAVVAVPPFFGCYIVNPLSAADQGIATAEPLYIDPVASPTLNGRGTTVALQPGQSWVGIPGSINPIWANAATAGHRFTVVRW